MLPAHVLRIVHQAEQAAGAGASLLEVLPVLRGLSLDDFGLVLWSMPSDELPRLSKVLPAMAPVAVQKDWTGSSGADLLVNTVWFPRLLNETMLEYRGVDLRGRSVLDVGCGYGRLVRLMYYYSDPDRISGVDPWPQSLVLCEGLPGTFVLVEETPQSYPVQPVDIAYAFSVFTHLTERAMHAVLAAVLMAMRPNALFVFTIRPVEYWAAEEAMGLKGTAAMVRDHHERGFANRVHNGRTHYGDTSMSLQYVSALPGWKFLRYDHSLTDPNQIAIVVTPA